MSRFDQLFLALSLILLIRLISVWPLSANFVELNPPEAFTTFRQTLAGQIDSLVPQPQAGLLSGIILGQKSDLSPDFQQALTATSTVHIVVASGQNLTILSGFLLALAPLIGRKKAVIFSTILCLIYTFISGLQIPIIRAAIMIVFAGIGQILNRETSSLRILGFTGLLMLIFEPNWLFSVSFQLSFLATVGVLVVAPELMKFAKVLPEVIREDLVVSFCAQTLTAPVIANVFHQFSIVGLLSNALVLWTVPIIMSLGMIGVAISFIPVVNYFSLLIPTILATYFIYIINFLNQDWVSLQVGYINNWILAGCYLLLLGLFILIKDHNLKQLSSQEKEMV